MGEIEKLTRDHSDLTVAITLNAAVASKMRFRVTGHYQGKHLHSLTKSGLLMSYKEYGVNKQANITS